MLLINCSRDSISADMKGAFLTKKRPERAHAYWELHPFDNTNINIQTLEQLSWILSKICQKPWNFRKNDLLFDENAYTVVMLIEFKVTNFCSIREEQTFSLVANKADKNLSNCLIQRNLPGLSETKFLKGAAIFGANASGKSNFLDAIRFLAQLVKLSATRMNAGDEIEVEPFRLDSVSPDQPSQFEVTFAVDSVRYTFGIAVTSQHVIEEYLTAFPKGYPQRWYRRKYDADAQAYIWQTSAAGFKHDKELESKTRPNALFLSVAAQFNHPQLTPVFDWFKQHLRFIDLGPDTIFLSNFTKRLANKNDAYRNRLLTLLQHADLGIVDMHVDEREIKVEKLKSSAINLGSSESDQSEADDNQKPSLRVEVNLLHTADGVEPVAFDFKDESAGTRRFFALIGPWMDILEQGYTVFIDEIDSSLHPLLVQELLKMLLCDEHNPNGAQIIFTTHNVMLLDQTLMRRDQIWFTEKTPVGATRLYPLTDFQPRQDEALVKGYLAGRYGGIPFLPEGLT